MEQNYLSLGTKKFPTTFVGLYQLAKEIVDLYVSNNSRAMDHIANVNSRQQIGLFPNELNNLCKYEVVIALKVKYSSLFDDKELGILENLSDFLRRKMRNKIVINLGRFTHWSFSYLDLVAFDNVVQVYTIGKFRYKKDCFYLANFWFENKFKKYLRTCDDCGEKYFDQESLLEDFSEPNDSVPNDLIGYDGQCNYCLRHYGSLRQCDMCGAWSDDVEEAVNTGNYVCYDCRCNGNYAHCEQCGDLIDLDDSYEYCNQYGYYFCSSDCAENYGLHWSENEEDWIDYDDDEEDDEVDEIITGYHSHSWRSYGDMKAGQKHKLYIGRETEVDERNRYDFSYDYYEGLLDMFKNRVVFETDGSLDGGFEIISHPMTESEFFAMDWKTVFDKLVADGWRSHNTSTCGEHFHYSKWYLGYNFLQQFNNAKKVIAFVEKNWTELVKLSRRDDCELSWCNKFGFVPNKKTEMSELSYNHNNRYFAVNLEHLNRHKDKDDENGTIEIRLCKGTLNPNTMLADADFWLHIVRNAKKISWKNIDNLKLWFKGLRPATIEHIKARNCFVGAF